MMSLRLWAPAAGTPGPYLYRAFIASDGRPLRMVEIWALGLSGHELSACFVVRDGDAQKLGYF